MSKRVRNIQLAVRAYENDDVGWTVRVGFTGDFKPLFATSREHAEQLGNALLEQFKQAAQDMQLEFIEQE